MSLAFRLLIGTDPDQSLHVGRSGGQLAGWLGGLRGGQLRGRIALVVEVGEPLRVRLECPRGNSFGRSRRSPFGPRCPSSRPGRSLVPLEETGCRSCQENTAEAHERSWSRCCCPGLSAASCAGMLRYRRRGLREIRTPRWPLRVSEVRTEGEDLWDFSA